MTRGTTRRGSSGALLYFAWGVGACTSLSGLTSDDAGPTDAGLDAQGAPDASDQGTADRAQPPATDAGTDAVSSYAAVVLSDDPIAYYRLDETSGSVAHDSSGHGLDATYGVGVMLGASPLIGEGGHAASFGGATDDGGHELATWIARNAAFEVPLVTIECWATARGFVGAYPTMVDHGAYKSPFQPYSLFLQGARPGAYDALAGDSGVYAVSPLTIAANASHYFAMTYDGSILRVFMDGTEAVNVAGGGSIGNYDSTTGLAIGATWLSGPTWDGDIDEVAIYGAALSANRIRAHYLAGTQP
jgi:hypothetical protein